MQVRSLGQEDPLEEGMATHSSIHAWRIPWTEEPDRLQSIGRKESEMTEVTQQACRHGTSSFNRLAIFFFFYILYLLSHTHRATEPITQTSLVTVSNRRDLYCSKQNFKNLHQPSLCLKCPLACFAVQASANRSVASLSSLFHLLYALKILDSS